ncbi:flagellar biosynthetic protein FliR [Acidimangrovimonas sediminis]|uniref:flagellar biosynthetic protein FliR n=1 Tax=Acidimangrovimonas sediminis TaxID=2056283 RepID=UPI000C801EE5|nr:flagellar biosynthetic protein FliR [Acidimangrovimonas sediminis]
MIEVLAQIAGLGQGWLAAAALVFLRVGAAMALLPGFGERAIPGRIRLVLALAFTAIITPALLPRLGPLGAPLGPAFLAAIFPEAITGLALGAVLRLFVQVLQMAGTMAAQSASLSQFFGGAGAEPQPAMAQILMLAGIALAMATGLHIRLAEALILSYRMVPPGQFPGPADLSHWGVANVARAFALAFSLAAPFVIGAVLYNAALGAINRAMPQLMVAFVGAPALTLGGLVLLAIAAPLMLHLWLEVFQTVLANPFDTPG